MTKSIGVQMEFTGTDNSVGVFMRDVAGSQLGDKVDIFIFESGTEDILGPQGMYLEIDENNPELTLWERSPDEWKRSAGGRNGQGRQAVRRAGDRQCRQLRLFPRQDRRQSRRLRRSISWSMMFESDKTRGRVGYDQTWTYSIGPAALYLMRPGQGQGRGSRRHDRAGSQGRRRLSDRAQEGGPVPYAACPPSRSRSNC